MLLVLLGPPGCGKGTQAERISEEYGPARISTGDMLREEVSLGTELGNDVKDIVERGELVPDGTILEMIRSRLEEEDASSGYIMDGFPRTLGQAEEFDLLMKEKGSEIDAVMAFEIGDDTIVKRLSSRRVCPECGAVYNLLTVPPGKDGICDTCGGALVLRDDDREETIRERLRVYRMQTRPLKEYYANAGLLCGIDADGTAGEVYERVKSIIGRLA